jgi:uncharacterized membrane protein YqjE
MDEAPHEPIGLLARGQRILRTLFDLAQTRLELFLVELQEQRVQVFDALLLVAVCSVCGLLTLVLLTFTLVVIFWETHRVLVLILLTLGYAGGATLAYWNLRNRLQRWPAFAATLDQLKKDRACIEKRN